MKRKVEPTPLTESEREEFIRLRVENEYIEEGTVADNIINRDFSTTAPLQKWTTDVSQFSFSLGKCCISPILDMNTN